MKPELLRIKLELKNLAKKIKIEKKKRCAKNNGYVEGLLELRKHYRHRHVLYCMAKGRKLEEIDSGDGLDMEYINFHLDALINDRKLYVVVDSTLSMSQQAVQAGHAIAAFMQKYPATTWKNGTLVLLKQDLSKSRYSYQYLYGACKHEIAEFCEPDLNNRLTAYVIFGPHLENNDNMRKLSLV